MYVGIHARLRPADIYPLRHTGAWRQVDRCSSAAVHGRRLSTDPDLLPDAAPARTDDAAGRLGLSRHDLEFRHRPLAWPSQFMERPGIFARSEVKRVRADE